MAKQMKPNGGSRRKAKVTGKGKGRANARKSLALLTSEVEALKKLEALEAVKPIVPADKPLFGFNRHSQIEKHATLDPMDMTLPYKTRGRLLNKPSVRLPCAEHSNYQMNSYFLRTGWERTMNGNAVAKENRIIVLAGMVRLFKGVYDHRDSTIVYPKLLTDEDYSFLQQQFNEGKRIFVIVTKDTVSGKWMDKKRALGAWLIPEEEERVMILDNMPSHIGVLVIQGNQWKFLDCNNFKNIDLKQKKIFDSFYNRIRTQVVRHLKAKLGLTPKEAKEFRVKRLDSLYTNGIKNACAVYCLYAIERLSLGRKQYDMNVSTSLCQLFALKVFCTVGGHLPWSLTNFPRGGYYFPYPETLMRLADGKIKTFQILRPAMTQERNKNQDDFFPVSVLKNDLKKRNEEEEKGEDEHEKREY